MVSMGAQYVFTQVKDLPIMLPDKVYSERTHDQVVSAGIEAEREHSCIKGILGISPFSATLDMVASIPIDYYAQCARGGNTLADKSMV